MTILQEISFALASISFLAWIIVSIATEFAYSSALLWTAMAFFLVGFWIAIREYAAAVADEWSED
ncbi:MAG: hypothetical protein AAFR88_05100 [Pseudomonadota bacterium]